MMNLDQRVLILMMLLQDGADRILISHKNDRHFVFLDRLNGAKHDFQRCKIPAHRVNSYFFTGRLHYCRICIINFARYTSLSPSKKLI